MLVGEPVAAVALPWRRCKKACSNTWMLAAPNTTIAPRSTISWLNKG
jgi:hypothetical protein